MHFQNWGIMKKGSSIKAKTLMIIVKIFLRTLIISQRIPTIWQVVMKNIWVLVKKHALWSFNLPCFHYPLDSSMAALKTETHNSNCENEQASSHWIGQNGFRVSLQRPISREMPLYDLSGSPWKAPFSGPVFTWCDSQPAMWIYS